MKMRLASVKMSLAIPNLRLAIVKSSLACIELRVAVKTLRLAIVKMRVACIELRVAVKILRLARPNPKLGTTAATVRMGLATVIFSHRRSASIFGMTRDRDNKKERRL